MQTMGDLLGLARDSAGDFQHWLQAADPVLANDLAEHAERHGLSSPQFARMAIADFSRSAAEEDWTTLMSALRETEDPGTACLLAMVQWRLTAPACEVHAGSEASERAANE